MGGKIRVVCVYGGGGTRYMAPNVIEYDAPFCSISMVSQHGCVLGTWRDAVHVLVGVF